MFGRACGLHELLDRLQVFPNRRWTASAQAQADDALAAWILQAGILLHHPSDRRRPHPDFDARDERELHEMVGVYDLADIVDAFLYRHEVREDPQHLRLRHLRRDDAKSDLGIDGNGKATTGAGGACCCSRTLGGAAHGRDANAVIFEGSIVIFGPSSKVSWANEAAEAQAVDSARASTAEAVMKDFQTMCRVDIFSPLYGSTLALVY
jgi:hypothetical protein